MRRLGHCVLVGLGIGFVVSTICICAYTGINEISKQFLAWMVASVLYGASCMLYDIEGWSRLRATVVHLVLCMTITLSTGWFLGYFHGIFNLLPGILPVFIIIYGLIYFVAFQVEKGRIREINEKLRKV